jgi:cytochrome c553
MSSKRRIGPLVLSLMLACASAATAIAQTLGTDPIADKAAACSVCHGEQGGAPVSTEIPIIWGQHAGYLFLNLRDFQSGARKSDVMAPIVATLSGSEMLALGQFFAQKPWPDLAQPRAPADVAAHAAAVAASGQCTSCHLREFLGDSAIPRLSGQSVRYLRKTMQDFHDGSRNNNPWMAALLKTFSESDIDALAQYLGGL